MGDQHDAEAILFHVHERETDAIDGDGAFRRHLLRQLRRGGKPNHFEFTVRRSFQNLTEAVDVAGDEMAAQPVAQLQGPFEIDALAVAQLAEVGLRQRFETGLKAATFGIMCHNREARAVDRDALAQRQIRRERRGDHQLAPVGHVLDANDGLQRLDDSGEHI